MTRRGWFIGIEWKPQDLWVGVFWKSTFDAAAMWPRDTPRLRFRTNSKTLWTRSRLDIWVCILPMLPIHFGWGREIR